MHIIYATDGSDGAAAAARLLATLPLDADSTITILTVVPDGSDPGGDARAAEEIVAAAAEQLGHTTGSLERRVRRGHPAEEIVRASDEHPTDLIVLGSHGRSALARFLLGSVAERVARHAPCPVLLVRGSGDGLRRLVLGVDGSEGAAGAAAWLRQFPLPAGCEVRLVTILPNLREITREHVLVTPPLAERSIPLDEWQRERASTRLADTAASFAAAGRPAVTEIRSGDPGPGLLDVAEDEGADLIVVGDERLGRIERLLVGSVAQQVLCHARCSVLVVRGPAGR